MRSITRFFSMTLAVCLLLGALSACGIPYHAQVYSGQATDLIREDFCAANRTGGAYYGNDVWTDDTQPRSRVFCVREPEEYEAIFRADAAVSADLETDMLVICTYTSCYVRPVVLKQARINGDTLELTLEEEAPRRAVLGVGDVCTPYQRYVVIRLDRLDVTDVKFTVEN